MKKILLVTSILLASLSYVSAQTGPEVDSKKIIMKGVDLHDAEKYDEAILEFKKVNKNDTNFVLASLELVNSYIASGKDSLAVIVCDQASVLPSSYAPSLLLYKANALDNMKKSDQALLLYQEGIKKYPLNNSFYYELGVLKYSQEKYKEAQDYIVQSIKCNPYHAASHNMMANIAKKQGKLIPAMLAWQFYLLIDNSSSRAKTIVGELEKMAKNEYEFKDVVKVDGLSEQDDFTELEALVRSKVALSSKYKSKIKLNFNITKQLQLVLEKLEVNKSDKGFFMEFYAPFFVDVNKKNYFEEFAYGILAEFNNNDVNSWLKKHKADSDKFSAWALEYLGQNVSTYDATLDGKKVNARHWYSNNKISSVGNQNAQGGNIGYWNFYYSNGILRSEGAFNDAAKREGLWRFYYPSGLIKNVENYKNGEVEGLVERYYSNGSIELNKNFIGSQVDGLKTLYYATGVVESKTNFKIGVQEGKESKFYTNGKLKYEIHVAANKYQGPLVQYYSNGHVSEKSNFKDDSRDGKYETFYNYPENKLKETVSYEKGNPVGEYKSYYRNDKVSEEGAYNKKGEKEGVWKNYYDTGVLFSEENFTGGKLTAVTKYYDPSGKLTEEYAYKNDVLQEYKAYDLTGKIVYQNKKDGKNNYDATLYYPNGNKQREGKVLGGKLTGSWKTYYKNGNISSEISYIEGRKDGKSVNYFENGRVKDETDYIKGETNGYYREYFDNGKLYREGAYILDKEIDSWKSYYQNGNLEELNFYIDGDLDGWQEYYSINGKIDFEEFYELGYVKKRVFYDTTGAVSVEANFVKGSGVLETKHLNGKTKMKVTYKDNMREGDLLEFYPNGTPLSVKPYVNNKANGDLKFYFPNGKLEAQRGFLEGDRHGKDLHYYEDGTLQKESNYSYGKQVGKTILYYPNKKVEREYDYENDDINGKSNVYAETGELMITRNYSYGVFLSYSYLDKNGVAVPAIDVKNETGLIKAYYQNGTLAIEYTLKNGQLVGKRTTYFVTGKVQEEENYVEGELSGPRKYYYASGKVKEEENYANGEKVGKCMYYHENGKIKKEIVYVGGKEHGIAKEYDATGKLLKTYVYYNDELIDEK